MPENAPRSLEWAYFDRTKMIDWGSKSKLKLDSFILICRILIQNILIDKTVKNDSGKSEESFVHVRLQDQVLVR